MIYLFILTCKVYEEKAAENFLYPSLEGELLHLGMQKPLGQKGSKQAKSYLSLPG